MATDVITVLTDDHREVDSLITRIESGTLTGDSRAEAMSRIIRELSMHAVAEELVLYPTVREVVPGGDALAEEAIAEHQRIEEALAELDGKNHDDPTVLDTLGTLAAEMRHHVEEEEGDLFPRLRASVSQERLVELGEKLQRAKKTAPTHPHPKAPNTPPANKILGPPTALLDRMRDALSR